MQLVNRVALVTGAGSGVGEGIARRFDGAGATVVIAELDEERGREVADSMERGHYIALDVGDREQVEGAVRYAEREFGALDILVNNAYPTGAIPKRLEERDDSDFTGALNAGFMGPWWAMRTAFPGMRDRAWGRVINICSLNGVNAHPYSAEYNASKEALRALSRTAAREWAKHGICVNVICPAARTAAFEMFETYSPENAALMLQQNPMGRMGDPQDDIGGVAVFLASEDARYLTGNTLFADGGGHINGVNWEPPVA